MQFGAEEATEDPQHVIHQLSVKAQYQLWHQRLGHLQPSTVTNMYKHVDGIPKLPEPSSIDNCPICLAGKLRKANSGSESTHTPTQCFQGISLDMGFVVQHSKNKERFEDNIGINWETCYILITDHHSGMVFGKPLKHKTAPEEWLNLWLARHSPDAQNKFAQMDRSVYHIQVNICI
jgi:hypothetical protein